jgi:DEAD/DEAH box helicase domain-containing protein
MPKVVGDGTRGFILSTGKGNPIWTIEPQVQIKNQFKNMPQKVVDFLMTPIDSSVSKPIVIETDGIKYHANSVTKDILDRLEMIRSGKVLVWSLAWHDLQSKSNKPFRNPLAPEALKVESVGSLGRVLSHFKTHQALIKQAQVSGSFELLRETLQSPGAFNTATGILIRGIVGQGLPPEKNQIFDELRTENVDWIKSNPMAQSTQAPNLDLYLSVERVQPAEFEQAFDDIRVLIQFNYPPVNYEAEITENFVAAFRGLWRAVNLLQVLNGLHIEFPGLDTLDLPVLAGESGEVATDIAWAEVRAEVLDEYHSLIDALIAAKVDAPDSIGEEIMEGNRVIGGAEIGWASRGLWVTDDDSVQKENIINWDLTAKALPAVVAEIISRLENIKGNNS